MNNWKTMPAHPLAAIFPRPTEVEFVALVQDMRERGYDKDQPIITADGQILDGLSRRDAAKEAGVEPAFKEHKSNDLLGFVISRNMHRRHLTTSQRQMIAADIANLTRESQVHDLRPESKYTAPAKALNVSERGVEMAAAVKRDATPEVAVAVRDGTITVNDASKIKDEKPAVQRRAVRDVESGTAPTARASVQNRNPDNVRDAAAQRIARQQAGPATAANPDPDTVPCATCKGTGRMTPRQAASARFVPPTLEEVKAYCLERGNDVDPEQWIDHYTSNGWKVGRNPMADWKGAVRTWERSEFSTNGTGKKAAKSVLDRIKEFEAKDPTSKK